MALLVKNPPANAVDVRDTGLTPGWEDPLEEGMATHSPQTEEPGVFMNPVHRVTKNWTRQRI